MFNKNTGQTTLNVNLGNNSMFNTNGDIELYGIDDPNNKLRKIGSVNDKPSSTTFNVIMPQYTIRLAIIKG